MLLDDRKLKILQAIIDDYINTAEPIGSRTIARKHELGLSSATIRNEMADLEEMGFLEQPHTSAGRIPSDKGYRLYVDRLMRVSELADEERERIETELEGHINEIGHLLKQTSSVMSRHTRYTSMAASPQMKRSILKAVQIVPIETGKALVIVVTNAGIVRNCMVNVDEQEQPDRLARISNILNEKLNGLSLEQINTGLIKGIEKELAITNGTLTAVLNGLLDCIIQIDNSEIYLDGATNIFKHPEFSNIVKAKEFLNILDEKQTLWKLLYSNAVDGGINIRIGSENPQNEIKECSLITTTYKIGEVVVGAIGVIGPTRMDYPKVISSLNLIRKKVNKELTRLFGQDEK